MDRVVRIFTGGSICQTGSSVDFSGMEATVLLFPESPDFKTLVSRIKSTFGWNEPGVVVGMQGRYDAGQGSKMHAFLVPILSADDWHTYKKIVQTSQVRALEVAVERTIVVEDLPDNLDVVNGNTEEQDPPMEERPSEEFVSVTRTNHDPLSVDLLISSPQRVVDPVTDFNGAVMNNELEEELFRDGTTREEESDEGWSSTEDEAPAPLFSAEESRVLRSVMGEVPSVHAFDDVSMVHKAVCANGLRSRDGIADPENDIIRKNLLFPTMEDMKVWLQEYSVRHHRPFIVQHSDVNKRYTVRCERGCGWKVWGRKTRDNQWKIANVKQPHTCGTAQVSREHLQATANFIARLLW